MKKLHTVEAEANTVKEAIDKALKALGVARSKVEIKVLSEGERGLFDMAGAKPARVRATTKQRPEVNQQ